MTEHEFDFTDCDTVRVTVTHGRVGMTGYHRGGSTESVSVDLPTAGVSWHDERVLAPTTDEWKASNPSAGGAGVEASSVDENDD